MKAEFAPFFGELFIDVFRECDFRWDGFGIPRAPLFCDMNDRASLCEFRLVKKGSSHISDFYFISGSST
jgi:hypothetical protein